MRFTPHYTKFKANLEKIVIYLKNIVKLYIDFDYIFKFFKNQSVMQLYALNDKNYLTFVDQAIRQHNYFCIECHAIVRRRGGFHRQDHFFHLDSTHQCRLNGKSLTHLQLQYHIQEQLPLEESHLEYRFPQIGRIADVAWPSKKIIFEIQCSFIKADEVESRIHDYKKIGYQVVWILHDQRYNQWRLTAAESALHSHCHYFSNMNEEGLGKIYDQLSWIDKGIRHKKSPQLPLNLINPLFSPSNKIGLTDKIPKILFKRVQEWPLYFPGDFIDKIFSNYDFKQWTEFEDSFIFPLRQKFNSRNNLGFCYDYLYKWIIRPYRNIFQMLLEKVCR